MRSVIRVFVSFSVSAGLVLAAAPARAQASLQVPVQFDFLNPGARSMSLGSAFVALADDATAAFTNPAGLDRLARPEFSFELRGRRYENDFLQTGRLSGTVSNKGIDTIPNPVYGTGLDSSGGLGFLSFVYPRKRWAVAAYRHELVRVAQFFQTQGVFLAGLGPGGIPNNDLRELPLQASRDMQITNYGGALSFKVTDKLSFGGGISVATFDLTGSFLRFLPPADFYGTADYSASRQLQLFTQNATNDTGVGFSAGMILRVNPKFQLGAVYRAAPQFHFDSNNQLVNPPSPIRSEAGIQFQTPNVMSAGAAWRPNDSVLVTLEYDFVAHSMVMFDYVNSIASVSPHPTQFSIKDANEIHGGVEWALTQVPKTPSLRFGAWYDPAHGVVYTPSSANDTEDLLYSHYLPERDAQTHFTFGAGVPINQHLEINGGLDFSGRTRLGSVSAVVRF
jgi:long-subunit fatty acid transport protein